MGSTPTEPNLDDDAELRQARAVLHASESEPSAAARAGLFSSITQAVAVDDASWIGLLRSRPTWLRRSLLLLLLAAIALSSWSAYGASAIALSPLRVGVSLAFFGLLMVVLSMLSLRPWHQPALSSRAEMFWVGGSLLCALGLSLWPGTDRYASLTELLSGALPCFVWGVAVALPVFVLMRVIDRGAWITGVLAALAAGLCANFALMTHCPTAGPEHMLLGHFAVIALFVAGYGLWSGLRGRRAG
jgi:hypothetical protein